MYADTIAAISTPAGEGGIGIVRVSGLQALPITMRIFSNRLSDHRLVYGRIIDPQTSVTIDEVLVSFMAAPNTYTREDIVEINCHGGIQPLQQILGLLLQHGARLAEPGEFTLRAFLNGRIDLSQAESVLDIIQAKTPDSLKLAVNALKGKLSGQIEEVRNGLLPVLAYLTARIDFPEDEVEEQDILIPVQNALEKTSILLASADTGIIYRQGIRTAIVGRPNVGKSSLLNLLLKDNRAIVTPVPGTTRDTIEEVMNLKGIPFILVDTAGIGQSQDPVESLGIARSRKAIDQAALVLLVIDQSEPLTDSDREIVSLLAEKKVVAAANKADLPPAADLTSLPWEIISTCALTGDGLHNLEDSMVRMATAGQTTPVDNVLVSNVRHKHALGRATEHLRAAEAGIISGTSDDLVTIDITEALNALGEITGQTVTEDLLDTIFSRFCIGK